MTTHAPSIERRRDQIRDQLIQDMRRQHRRRRTRNTSVAALLLLVLGAVPLWLNAQHPGAAPPSIAHHPPPQTPSVTPDPAPAAPTLRIVRLANPTDVMERARITDIPSIVQRIDDGALIQLLADIGRPSGVIRQGDRAWLTSDVTTASTPDGI